METTTNGTRGWASGEREMRRNLGRNQDFDIQAQLPTLSQLRDRTRCSKCNHDERHAKGRNLVVCLDGTTNQFGRNNTNVLEFCSRVEKDDLHELLYLSGIGTLPESKPPLGQRWDQFTDLLFAHTFNQRVLAGYRWLSNMYRPGDKIFIYGFSRGAYQAMALAAMIDTVGLLRRHNEQQLPFALEMYLKCETEDYKERAKNFKKALSWDIRVHFLGLWDTVSSLGKGRKCPRTDNLHEFVCYIRHALALDELRVKFIPEYLGGNTPLPDEAYENSEDGITRVKEVWFAGSHSDVGGGNVPNAQLNNASVPVLWMVNQSIAAGLSVTPSDVDLSVAKLKNMQTNDSMTFWYRILEFLPLHWSTYDERKKKKRLHRSSPRVIKPTQKLHISICFIDGYKPLATCHPQMNIDLDEIVGQGKLDQLDWIDSSYAQHLEKDLFDITQIREIFDRWAESQDQDSSPEAKTDLQRLVFLASVREGAQAILQEDKNLKQLREMIENESSSALELLNGLLKTGSSPFAENILGAQTRSVGLGSKQSMSRLGLPNLIELVERANSIDQRGRFTTTLDMFAEEYGALPLGTFDSMSDLRTSIESEGDGSPPHKWVDLALASLYFGRYMQSRAAGDLREARLRLEAHSLVGESSPHSRKAAIIWNWLATITEVDGTKETLQKAFEIRTRLVEQHPNDEYNRDLQNTRLALVTREVHDQADGTFDIHPYITTRYKRALIHDDMEFAKVLSNLSNRLYDLDQKDEALKIAELSVETFRRAFVQPATFNTYADMATVLNNLSNRLSDASDYIRASEIMVEVAEIRRRLVASTSATVRDTRDLAVSLHNLSLRYCDLGNEEKALSTARQAVSLGRQLVKEHPDDYDTDLADFLNNLSHHQSEHDALESLKEVVSLRRQPKKERSRIDNAVLADSLHALSNRRSKLGLREDALASISEAVSLQRQLAKDQPRIYDVVLARCLIDLSGCQSILGHTKDAFESIQDAVSLYRSLAAKQPHNHDTDLAMALHNLSLHQSDIRQREESRKSAMEAFLLDGRLAIKRPDLYNSDLAASLFTLALSQREGGHPAEAIKAAEGAVFLYRQLENEQPHAYKSLLARYLINLSDCQSDLIHRVDAIESIKEAVSLYRPLAEEQPLVYNTLLAMALHKLSIHQSDLGQRENSRESAMGAFLLDRQLAIKRPDVYDADLAETLCTLGRSQREDGRSAEAIKTAEGVVFLYRRLANEQPHIYKSTLARCLIDLSDCQSDLGRRLDAIESIQEAISLYKPLASEQPLVYNTDLAMALHNLSLLQSDLGEREDSRKSAMEAFLLDEQLAIKRPDVYNADLAESLYNLAYGYCKDNRHEKGHKPAEGAVFLYRLLANEQPHVYESGLASSLNVLSIAQFRLGFHQVALECQKELVFLRRQLAKQEPLVHNESLAVNLYNLSLSYSNLKLYDDALDTALESFRIFRDLSPRPSNYKKMMADRVERVKRCLSGLGRRAEADRFTIKHLVEGEGGKFIIREDPNSSGVAIGLKEGSEGDEEAESDEAERDDEEEVSGGAESGEEEDLSDGAEGEDDEEDKEGGEVQEAGEVLGAATTSGTQEVEDGGHMTRVES
ncbi:hypothetical protein NLI96_g3923 [Meripilus lineatus]|uniref:DUF2235 domain-containing protein n=1 Tax=Meripilus lineatus TaxID=2056292 RepID=A0AAD5V5W3_9APHY|nr:hypothetical protein NLI96_g3923 [Physisporinus lineatus]